MELLVCNQKLEGDATSGWDAGDVLLIRPDDFRWGRKEVSSRRFRIIRQPGSDPKSLRYLLEQGKTGRRRWHVLIDDITAVDKQRSEPSRIL